VRTRLLQAKSDLTTAKAAEQAALVQLSQTVGHILRSNTLHAPKAGLTEPAVPALTNLLTDAIERNASLRRIALDIATNQHETEQKRAALWPTIGLRAEHQRSNAVGGNSNSKDNRLFVVLEYTPGAGLSARMQIDAQLARTQSLSESAETAKRDLVERIAIEYQDYFAGQSRQQSLQGLLVANRDVLASYDRLFLAGKRGWLDVVNAARELMQIEVTDADLSAQQDGALYRLRLLAGEQPWLSRAPASVSVDTPFERLFDAVNQKISQ
jgi:adhesin transport system outer membrane protein